MIKFVDDTVFNTPAEWIVNTVNCVGFMGAGLALEFRLRYPALYEKYKEDCKNNIIRVGKMNYYQDNEVKAINFPTKIDFKDPSKIEWIASGLDDLIATYKAHGVTSIAIPKLGAKNGGLDWEEVKKLIIHKTSTMPITVYICEDSNPASGIEKTMLDFIKSYNLLNLDLRSDRYRPLEKNIKQAKRFFDIKGDGVGIHTFEKVFIQAYLFAKGKPVNQTHKHYSTAEIMEILDQVRSPHLHVGEILSPKQKVEFERYLESIQAKGFSFYEFLSLNKPWANNIRKHCLNQIPKQLTLF